MGEKVFAALDRNKIIQRKTRFARLLNFEGVRCLNDSARELSGPLMRAGFLRTGGFAGREVTRTRERAI
jgi:hypothetical protein